MGEPISRAMNSIKFVPGRGMVVAGCTDDIPAKCFNFKTGGQLVNDFYKLKRSCFSIDVAKDASMVTLGDFNGNLEVDSLVYASL